MPGGGILRLMNTMDRSGPGAARHEILSARNPFLKEIRKAIVRGGLTESGLAVAESFHLLEEALRSGCEVPEVLASQPVLGTVEKQVGKLQGVRLSVLPDALFQQLAGTETSQGVMALVRPPVWSMEQLVRGRTLLVVLDGVQDPGNAGALIRAAEAFGATGLLLTKGSVNPYNPKVLRASAGSLFRLPLLHGMDPDLVLTVLRQRNLDVFAATAGAAVSAEVVDLTRRCALVIGSEGHGVGAKLREAAAGIAIPTVGVESLNAAVAGAVLLYEASRQRRHAGERP